MVWSPFTSGSGKGTISASCGRRIPAVHSDSRSSCGGRLTVCDLNNAVADASAPGRARRGRRCAHPIICSTSDRASRAVLACTVVIDPSCPVFIACSIRSSRRGPHADDDRWGAAQRALDEVALGDRLAFDVRGRFRAAQMFLR